MIVELTDLTLGYGARRLVEQANVVVDGARLVALLGRNGTGKSTLLRALAGLEAPMQGAIVIDGRPVDRLSAAERARLVSFVTTERVCVPGLRVYDMVALGRAPYTGWSGRLGKADREAIVRALELTGMTAYADRTMDAMSDGECQRVMITRALAQDTPFVLLDEPTSFLDLPARYDLCLLLRRLTAEAGKCVIFSTHELDIALSLCDAVLLIDAPRLHYLPTPEMIASGHVERLFQNEAVRFDTSACTQGRFTVNVRKLTRREI